MECDNCGSDNVYADEEDCIVSWICGNCGWYQDWDETGVSHSIP